MCVCMCVVESSPSLSLPLSLPPPEKGENAGGNNAAEIFVLFLGIVGADRPSDTAGLGALFPSILVGGSEMDKRRKTRKEEPGRRRVRCNRDDSWLERGVRRDSPRRGEPTNERPFFPLDSQNGARRYATFLLSFSFFSSDRKRPQHRCGGRGGEKLSFVHHEED